MEPRAVRFARCLASGRLDGPGVEALDRLCRDLWPGGVASDDEEERLFLEHLALRAPSGQALGAWLRQVSAKALHLVAGCLAGRASALARFELEHGRELVRAATRVARQGGDGESFVQELRVRLFLGEASRPPLLASYDGMGDLRAWMRVTVSRAVLDELKRLERQAGRERLDESLYLATLGAGISPELGVLGGELRGAVRAAFTQALRALSPRDRTLLRQAYLRGLSVDSLGRLLGVPRSTAARHLAAARNALVSTMRSALCGSLGVDERELDSIVRAIQSQLELSTERLQSASG